MHVNFVVDDTVKTKRFFVRQRKRYRSSRSNREFFAFSWRERFVPFLSSRKKSDRVHEHFDLVEVIMKINVYVLAVGSCEGEMSYQYQSVYLSY